MTACPTSQPAAAAKGAAPGQPALAGDRAVRVPRQRRASQPSAEPLGSLTQQGAAPDGVCRSCFGTALTRLRMQLQDGLPVDFVSCHDCETRWWENEQEPIDVQSVLARSARS